MEVGVHVEVARGGPGEEHGDHPTTRTHPSDPPPVALDALIDPDRLLETVPPDAILNAVEDGLVVFDETGAFRFATRLAAGALEGFDVASMGPAAGWTAHDALGRPITTTRRPSLRALAAGHPDHLIIGSDQTLDVDGDILGKPGNFENAMAQLRDMRGKMVEFHSALCVYDARNGETQATDVVTRVKFRDLPDTVLAAYLHAETPYDCAGSAKSEGLGIMLLESIENDDPTALIGLPLIALTSMLMRAGIALPGAAPALAGSAA